MKTIALSALCLLLYSSVFAGEDVMTFDLNARSTYMLFARATLPYPIRDIRLGEKEEAAAFCLQEYGPKTHAFAMADRPGSALILCRDNSQDSYTDSPAHLSQLCQILTRRQYIVGTIEGSILSCRRGVSL